MILKIGFWFELVAALSFTGLVVYCALHLGGVL